MVSIALIVSVSTETVNKLNVYLLVYSVESIALIVVNCGISCQTFVLNDYVGTSYRVSWGWKIKGGMHAKIISYLW